MATTRIRQALLATALVTALVLFASGAPSTHAAAVAPRASARAGAALITTAEPWAWPVPGTPTVTREFVAPAHRYGAGHRGVDLVRADGVLTDVLAPASGTVAYVGSVAGRPLITIDHGDGLVTTLEPVASVLATGATVARGEVVGSIAAGGHTATGGLHFGVRLHGAYVNPRLLIGGIPRAVLVPCCL